MYVQVEVTSGSQETLATFYTCLYHVFCPPTQFNEVGVGGIYLGLIAHTSFSTPPSSPPPLPSHSSSPADLQQAGGVYIGMDNLVHSIKPGMK